MLMAQRHYLHNKYNKHYCYRIVKKLPTKYTATSNSWMTSATFEEFLVQLDCQGATKILLLTYQCVAHPGDNTAQKNTEVIFFSPNCTSHLQPLDTGIMRTFKCEYRKQLIWKAVAVINGELFGDAGSLYF